ncbi:MAG: type I DNA topoisomerase [Phycisphaeraceae bacterium]|nr:type I DNA topoisomerase [Phycisphaeraceae bacterium]
MAKSSGKGRSGSSRATGTKAKTSRRGGIRQVKDATGKHLVIVESPTKAKTINKYLGNDYVVMASVGHVRDLPGRAPKGVKQEVPGVDLENNFAPTYEILPDKRQTVADLKKAAKHAADVWFATDLDREGEAIAWHLAAALGVELADAKRVVFNAITQAEIAHAFTNPRKIDENKVNAQQARRVLDRIVGYQVSPLLWKKVAGGLSAGRVQSVAVRLVVEREREIEAFIPEEYWKITGIFATDPTKTNPLAQEWRAFLADVAEGKERTVREKLIWLSEHSCLRAELTEVNGQAFRPGGHEEALATAAALGLTIEKKDEWEEPKAKGMARFRIRVLGHVGSQADYRIKSIETKRTTSRPGAPFITSTLQQAAANQLGFPLQRTMRIAQQLYEGVDIHGREGQVGLITYMRTDSTHLSPEALGMARDYIGKEWGPQYLPDKPNVYTSSNKLAQEAHEAIRPTDVNITPKRVRSALTEEQYKLYRLIWERFLASQMVPAQWDSTVAMIEAATAALKALFKANGRRLIFDGCYKATGVPESGEEAMLPPLKENQKLGPMQIDPTQHFTSPPPRYTEASLQKELESRGIGRPSTYAAIIQTIQDRKYAESVAPRDKRLRATDLGKVVTDKLVEAFPRLMDVDYTRQMETELDKIEEEHHDWVTMLREFYGPFKENLAKAHLEMVHAKAESEPASFDCPKCGAGTVYRFGKNGRFLSCSTYPKCEFAAPIDAEGNPLQPEMTDIVCPECGSGMTRRTGRFGPFLGCVNYPKCKGILKLDPKKQTLVLPKVPPLLTDVPCPKCGSPLNMRTSKRGYWLSCSTFPKCRGRVAWSAVEEPKQKALDEAYRQHEAAHPAPQVRNTQGQILGDDYMPQITGGPPPGENAETPLDSDAA